MILDLLEFWFSFHQNYQKQEGGHLRKKQGGPLLTDAFLDKHVFIFRRRDIVFLMFVFFLAGVRTWALSGLSCRRMFIKTYGLANS